MQPILEQAVEAAYRRYFAVISRKCARMLGDRQEATDVAQETFARLWEERDALLDPLAITAWIYRTSTRLAIERLRKRPKSEPADGAEIPAHDDPERSVEARRLLERLSSELSDRVLEVAILNRLDELTQAEIAELLGLSERTVRRDLVELDRRARLLTIGVAG
jgi:RNA polymerase sigma-70 factor, ECF subfamily